MALRRPDVWPTQDLALAVAMQDVKGLGARPTPDQLEVLGELWRPWRAIAARLLWHHYLCQRAPRITAAASAGTGENARMKTRARKRPREHL